MVTVVSVTQERIDMYILPEVGQVFESIKGEQLTVVSLLNEGTSRPDEYSVMICSLGLDGHLWVHSSIQHWQNTMIRKADTCASLKYAEYLKTVDVINNISIPNLKLLHSINLPEPGSVWLHKSGTYYQVLLVASLWGSTCTSEVSVIGYRSLSGSLWGRTLTRWHLSMTQLPNYSLSEARSLDAGVPEGDHVCSDAEPVTRKRKHLEFSTLATNNTKEAMVNQHYHRGPKGKLVACYHTCHSVLASPAFWIGTFITWPVEHYVWEHVWPFQLLASAMGL